MSTDETKPPVSFADVLQWLAIAGVGVFILHSFTENAYAIRCKMPVDGGKPVHVGVQCDDNSLGKFFGEKPMCGFTLDLGVTYFTLIGSVLAESNGEVYTFHPEKFWEWEGDVPTKEVSMRDLTVKVTFPLNAVAIEGLPTGQLFFSDCLPEQPM